MRAPPFPRWPQRQSRSHTAWPHNHSCFCFRAQESSKVAATTLASGTACASCATSSRPLAGDQGGTRARAARAQGGAPRPHHAHCAGSSRRGRRLRRRLLWRGCHRQRQVDDNLSSRCDVSLLGKRSPRRHDARCSPQATAMPMAARRQQRLWRWRWHFATAPHDLIVCRLGSVIARPHTRNVFATL